MHLATLERDKNASGNTGMRQYLHLATCWPGSGSILCPCPSSGLTPTCIEIDSELGIAHLFTFLVRKHPKFLSRCFI